MTGVQTCALPISFAIARHDPDLAPGDALGLFDRVAARQVQLVAEWMGLGFVHGVMNTDNMAVSGETIDYGPCAFMEAYGERTVFSSIDRHGRYAFHEQPRIAGWNLARFAEAILPLLHPEPDTAVARANAALESFSARFQGHWLAVMRGKLGLFTAEPEDGPLAEALLRWMHGTGADYTHTFRNLRPSLEPSVSDDSVRLAWHQRWSDRLSRQPQSWTEVRRLMEAHNPAVIPRNHEVEAALAAATTANDLRPLERLLSALKRPYEDGGQPASLLNPPPPGTPVCRTFCGT